MTNGEGPNEPRVPQEGDEDTRTPDEIAANQSKAADEWDNRYQGDLDAMRARDLASIQKDAEDLLAKVQAEITNPALAEEDRHDRQKLEQLEGELASIRRMRAAEARAEVDARRVTRDTFRRMARGEHWDDAVRPTETVASTDIEFPVTEQDLLEFKALVDEVREEQGLPPKYGNPMPTQANQDVTNTTKDAVEDKHQRWRNNAADNI